MYGGAGIEVNTIEINKIHIHSVSAIMTTIKCIRTHQPFIEIKRQARAKNPEKTRNREMNNINHANGVRN